MQCLSRVAVLALTALVLAACQTTTSGPTPQLAKRFDPALWESIQPNFHVPGLPLQAVLRCQRPRCPMNALVVLASAPLHPQDAALLRGEVSDSAIKQGAHRPFLQVVVLGGSSIVSSKTTVTRGKTWVQVDEHGEAVTRNGALRRYVFRIRTDPNGTKATSVIADNLSDARRILSQAAGAF